jgi:hypothetical protein
MFDSLDEEMKRNERVSSSPRERWIKYLTVLIASLLVFGGLYAGIILFA